MNTIKAMLYVCMLFSFIIMSEFTEIKRKQEISLPKEDENVTQHNEDENVEAPEPET